MFWYKLPQKWGIVGINFGQKFQFSKVLLSPKFKNNSIIIEVKKKILYHIVYHTLEWNIDPIESNVKYVVEIFRSASSSRNRLIEKKKEQKSFK